MNHRHILGTFKSTVLKFNSPTKNNRIYDSCIYNQIKSDPVVNEQLNNDCLFVTMDGEDLSHVAGIVTDLIYSETQESMEASVDVVDTPQGRILDVLLSDNQMVSLTVCGYETDDRTKDDKPHVITNYQLEKIQACPYQNIWDDKIEYHKKE